MARQVSNKSQAVREELSRNPKAKAREVVLALKSKGIVVQPGLVYFIKGRLARSKKRSGENPVRKMVAINIAAKGINIELLRDIKVLADKAGGYDTLTSLIEVLR